MTNILDTRITAIAQEMPYEKYAGDLIPSQPPSDTVHLFFNLFGPTFPQTSPQHFLATMRQQCRVMACDFVRCGVGMENVESLCISIYDKVGSGRTRVYRYSCSIVAVNQIIKGVATAPGDVIESSESSELTAILSK